MAKILLAEPEPRRAQIMERTLCEARFVVEVVGDGEQAEAWAKVNDYEAVILALDLPRRSGLDICRDLREHDADTPVVLLGQREQLPQLIRGLAASADYLLTHPFPPAKLTACLKALLRRRHQQRLPNLVVGPLTFDQTHRKIYLHDHEMSLTPKEFGILELLIRRAECIVSRTELVETVWCDTLDAMLSHRLESHISQLRKKLGDSKMIRAYSGRGYELVRV